MASLVGSMASRIAQNLNIQTWLLKGASIDDIFTQLSLKTAGSKIFEDPKFMTWVVYVTKAEKQNAGDVILAKLMTQYTPDSLAAMIAAAKKVSSTESLARVLQAQQRQVWLSTGESGDDIFKMIKLDEAGAKLFESPQFTTWASYVDEFNRNIPNKAVSMLTLLAKHYDDVDLGKMLEAAKKVPSTESIAAKLQSELKASVAGGKSPENFFRILKLDDTGTELFKSPEFPKWISYVDDFNAKNPGEAVPILAKLTKLYGEATLSEMIEVAKKVSTTESIAKKLQAQQNLQWLSKQKSPDDVFKLLKLDEPSLAILTDPKLSAWGSYLMVFNSKNPGKETTLIATLTSHYTDLGVAQLLQEGKKFTQTKKIAEDLQSAQFARWFYDGKTKKDLLSIMKLKKATWRGDPNAVIIREYMKFYNAMKNRTYS
ncbi:hypothetical protein PC129_g13062 [Phytophthora cactorum]|nr:hypothetical protein PC113_g11500 [Phytophthora cactorum]KAG3150038.1 hypothetical protein C6341_g16869 [Phytophthora cactorum]KAG3216065.1 hypothetical protein PC129_g13062 [Phytophthora cactorum]